LRFPGTGAGGAAGALDEGACCCALLEGIGVMPIGCRPFSNGVMFKGFLPSFKFIEPPLLVLSLMCLASAKFEIEKNIVPTIANTKQPPDTHLKCPTHSAAGFGALILRLSFQIILSQVFEVLFERLNAQLERRNRHEDGEAKKYPGSIQQVEVDGVRQRDYVFDKDE
jgi:hypothetical protein